MENGKEILAGFFEDRPDELAENLILNWPKYEDIQHEKEYSFLEQHKADKLKFLLMLKRQKETQLVQS